jgi:O-antigen/teichoic acid export membrane protein
MKRFIRALSVLLTGTLLSSGFSFVTQLLVARNVEAEQFGRLAALLAVVNFLTPLSAAGMGWFLLEVYGREGQAARRWLAPSAKLVSIGCVVGALLLLAYAFYGGRAPVEQRHLAGAACLAILLGQVAVEVAAVRFQLEENFTRLASWQASTQLGRLLVLIVLIGIGGEGLRGILLGYAIVGVATAVLGLSLMAQLRTDRVTLKGHASAPPAATGAPSFAETARRATPFALVTMFYVLFFQGVLVTLDWLEGGAAAASYNAAFLILSALLLLPGVIYTKLLAARLYRWARHDTETFVAAFHVGVIAMLALGILLLAATVIAAPVLIPLLFGERYQAAVPVLLLLSLTIPLRCVQSVYSSLFTSPTDTVRKAWYLAAAAVISVAGSFALVPPLGVRGAALAALLAECVLLVLHVIGTARHIEGVSVSHTFQPAILRSSVRHLLRNAGS